MRKWNIWGTAAVATTLGLAASGNAQNSTPQPATEHAPVAPAAESAGSTTPAAAEPVAGVAPSAASANAAGANAAAGATQETGKRAANQWAPAAQTFPTPARDNTNSNGQAFGGEQSGMSNTNRGELGVWLVEGAGPGVEIRRITTGSAADQAGLHPGDVILQINGRGASSPLSVAQMIRDMPAGQTATVDYWRDGQMQKLDIALQPLREQREVAYRGEENPFDDEMSGMPATSGMGGLQATNGDLETRTARLEQQMASLMQELRLLRQDVAQHRDSGGAMTTEQGAGTLTSPAANHAPGATATPPAATTEPAAEAPAATTNDLFGTEPKPATSPAANGTAPPAEKSTAPAANATTESDDAFGDSSAAPPTGATPSQETTPAAGETPKEGAPAAGESKSDDLFQ